MKKMSAFLKPVDRLPMTTSGIRQNRRLTRKGRWTFLHTKSAQRTFYLSWLFHVGHRRLDTCRPTIWLTHAPDVAYAIIFNSVFTKYALNRPRRDLKGAHHLRVRS